MKKRRKHKRRRNAGLGPSLMSQFSNWDPRFESDLLRRKFSRRDRMNPDQFNMVPYSEFSREMGALMPSDGRLMPESFGGPYGVESGRVRPEDLGLPGWTGGSGFKGDSWNRMGGNRKFKSIDKPKAKAAGKKAEVKENPKPKKFKCKGCKKVCKVKKGPGRPPKRCKRCR